LASAMWRRDNQQVLGSIPRRLINRRMCGIMASLLSMSLSPHRRAGRYDQKLFPRVQHQVEHQEIRSRDEDLRQALLAVVGRGDTGHPGGSRKDNSVS
jgi:hypothetical protein